LIERNLKKADESENITSTTIKNKVDEYLKRKSKKIDALNEKASQDFNENHTFCPKTNVDKSQLGNFNEFINGQTNFIKKVEDNKKIT